MADPGGQALGSYLVRGTMRFAMRFAEVCSGRIVLITLASGCEGKVNVTFFTEPLGCGCVEGNRAGVDQRVAADRLFALAVGGIVGAVLVVEAGQTCNITFCVRRAAVAIVRSNSR